MVIFNGLSLLLAIVILFWSFVNINMKYFIKDLSRKSKLLKGIALSFISPLFIHILSQLIVFVIIWCSKFSNGEEMIAKGIKDPRIMLIMILVQLILLPIIIHLYSVIVKRNKKICAFIYLTTLSMISFMDEISVNAHVFLFLTILFIVIVKVFFNKDIEIIMKNEALDDQNNMAILPVIAYTVVLSLAVLWNTVDVNDNSFTIAFSFVSFTFCIFVFTTYKYAFSNYTKQVEILERIKEKKNMLEIENKTQEGIILTLSEITEAKSGQTGKHVKRVSEYTRVLAEALDFSSEEVDKMRVASMMHDIGKLMIPSEILDKKGRLTAEEFEIIKTHAALGEEILHNTNGPIMDCAKIIALDHHEKWDGNGYNRKKGTDISIEGRIVAVADVYDALVSKRSYKDAWNEQDAKNEIVGQSGKQFDPSVVTAFENHYDEILTVCEKYKDQE